MGATYPGGRGGGVGRRPPGMGEGDSTMFELYINGVHTLTVHSTFSVGVRDVLKCISFLDNTKVTLRSVSFNEWFNWTNGELVPMQVRNLRAYSIARHFAGGWAK